MYRYRQTMLVAKNANATGTPTPISARINPIITESASAQSMRSEAFHFARVDGVDRIAPEQVAQELQRRQPQPAHHRREDQPARHVEGAHLVVAAFQAGEPAADRDPAQVQADRDAQQVHAAPDAATQAFRQRAADEG